MTQAAFNAHSSPLSQRRRLCNAAVPIAKDLALRRLSLNHRALIAGRLAICRENRISIRIAYSMSEAESKTTEATEKKTKKEVPPPPEKPEAGDCCGSGCVRCVWDVYYDELDEYNKLLKEISEKPESPVKSSNDSLAFK